MENFKTTIITEALPVDILYKLENAPTYNNGNYIKRSHQLYDNGDFYEGNIADGKRCGHGIYSWSNGAQYTGGWLDNQCHGYGTMHYADGGVYCGNWIYDKRNGYGELKLTNGTVYKGNWVDDSLS